MHSIPKTIKSSLKNLPVMVAAAVMKRDGTCYKMCSKHGRLSGTFSRAEVAYRKNYSKEILRIDPTIEDFQTELSLQQACREFNNLTGCNCVTDCSLAARCSCKGTGMYCTTLCHEGRGKNKFCTLFADLFCAEEEQEDTEDEESAEEESTPV